LIIVIDAVVELLDKRVTPLSSILGYTTKKEIKKERLGKPK